MQKTNRSITPSVDGQTPFGQPTLQRDTATTLPANEVLGNLPRSLTRQSGGQQNTGQEEGDALRKSLRSNPEPSNVGGQSGSQELENWDDFFRKTQTGSLRANGAPGNLPSDFDITMRLETVTRESNATHGDDFLLHRYLSFPGQGAMAQFNSTRDRPDDGDSTSQKIQSNAVVAVPGAQQSSLEDQHETPRHLFPDTPLSFPPTGAISHIEREMEFAPFGNMPPTPQIAESGVSAFTRKMPDDMVYLRLGNMDVRLRKDEFTAIVRKMSSREVSSLEEASSLRKIYGNSKEQLVASAITAGNGDTWDALIKKKWATERSLRIHQSLSLTHLAAASKGRLPKTGKYKPTNGPGDHQSGMSGSKISNELWAALAPLIPGTPLAKDDRRQTVGDRAALNGILFVLQNRIAWNQLPKELGYGSGRTCHRRLRDWQAAGVWEQLHQRMLRGLRDESDRERSSLDDASVSSPSNAASRGAPGTAS